MFILLKLFFLMENILVSLLLYGAVTQLCCTSIVYQQFSDNFCIVALDDDDDDDDDGMMKENYKLHSVYSQTQLSI